MVGTDARTWAWRKNAARYGWAEVPRATQVFASSEDARSVTPPLHGSFAGMADSASTCPYFGGCQPPDSALAASSAWVVQGVNTSFAVYTSAGALQSGWPKSAQSFFNVPAPGTCDPLGPYMSDPRAVYDPVDGRFWLSALQTEGAFGINACPEQSTLWVAVSASSDPTSTWSVYSFDLLAGTTNASDFAQIGLDASAFYFSSNAFDSGGGSFQYAQTFAASKATMEAGMPVVANGLTGIQVAGKFVDTVQPVLVEGTSAAAGLFVASQNIKGGGGNCVHGCKGIYAFAMANPLTAPALTDVMAKSPLYMLAPLADQPNCAACVETFDTRISATPVYAGGLITFALESGVSNGTQVVPGVYWGQLKPVLSGATMHNAFLKQTGVVSFSGDQAASYGALMPDGADNVIMAFDTMSSTLAPGIEYAGRLASDPAGTFSTPIFVRHGSRTFDTSWGEYGATSYEGTATNKIWFAAEYGNTNGDWATRIASTHF